MSQMKWQINHGHKKGYHNGVEGDFGDPVGVERRKDSHISKNKEHNHIHAY